MRSTLLPSYYGAPGTASEQFLHGADWLVQFTEISFLFYKVLQCSSVFTTRAMANKLRILCLHGWKQSADVFKAKTAVLRYDCCCVVEFSFCFIFLLFLFVDGIVELDLWSGVFLSVVFVLFYDCLFVLCCCANVMVTLNSICRKSLEDLADFGMHNIITTTLLHTH